MSAPRSQQITRSSTVTPSGGRWRDGGDGTSARPVNTTVGIDSLDGLRLVWSIGVARGDQQLAGFEVTLREDQGRLLVMGSPIEGASLNGHASALRVPASDAEITIDHASGLIHLLAGDALVAAIDLSRLAALRNGEAVPASEVAIYARSRTLEAAGLRGGLYQLSSVVIG